MLFKEIFFLRDVFLPSLSYNKLATTSSLKHCPFLSIFSTHPNPFIGLIEHWSKILYNLILNLYVWLNNSCGAKCQHHMRWALVDELFIIKEVFFDLNKRRVCLFSLPLVTILLYKHQPSNCTLSSSLHVGLYLFGTFRLVVKM